MRETARSWLVLGVVTFSIFLDVGITKGFSVLLPELKEQLVSQTWIIGSSIGILTGFGFVLGKSDSSLETFCSL